MKVKLEQTEHERHKQEMKDKIEDLELQKQNLAMKITDSEMNQCNHVKNIEDTYRQDIRKLETELEEKQGQFEEDIKNIQQRSEESLG